MGSSPKLVLAMIDSLDTKMLERAIDTGRAPTLKLLRERGTYIRECVSSFPSLTPVASASLVTGKGPAAHHVPSMNWFSRGELRYVEYGSSWQAARTFGVLQTLFDTVYNMNLEQLSRETLTLFERIEDAGLRAACTPFLIYRGRQRHRVALEGVMKRVVDASTLAHATYGPSEFFYGELFHSRPTGCPPTFARVGNRDEFTGCVGAYLAERDLFDFLLFSLPDNDFYSHRYGPGGSVASIGAADRSIKRLVDAAGGIEAFLGSYAVVVVGDHSQTEIRSRLSLLDVFDEMRVLKPNETFSGRAQIAVSPGARSAMVYLLGESDRRRLQMREEIADRLAATDGVDLVLLRGGNDEGSEACVRTKRGELRFAPGSEYVDERSRRWDLSGDRKVLDLVDADGLVSSRAYPDALGRIWSALGCRDAGDILLSVAPGYECVDWGGSDHVGGGSHGSLHRDDSVVPLICVNCGPASATDRRLWSIEDVYGIVLRHFGIDENDVDPRGRVEGPRGG